ncbi:MAG: hypothetical protein AABW58_00545 [Nanoarchaeota archaeon]
MLNKKGFVFEPILVIFAVLILSTGLYNFITNKGIEKNLGDSSFNIVELEKESKLQLGLMEQAALYHVYNSIVKFAENSGFSEYQIKECKLWDDFKLNEKCSLNKEKLRENLKIYVQNSFNEYSKLQGLGLYTVDVKEENNKLIFTFNSPNVNFKKENVEFSINHNFKKEVVYDLNFLEDLYKKAILRPFADCNHAKEEIKIENLECGEETLALSFTYVQNKFHFGENENSLEYPAIPIIKFKLSKIIIAS